MTLITCPECNKEISSVAQSCPECGHPINDTPTVTRRVVATRNDTEDGFPAWMIAPIAVVGVLLLFGLFYMIQTSDRTDKENLNVAVETELPASQRDGTITSSQTGTSQDTTGILPPDTSTVETSNPENNQTIGADRKTEIIDNVPDKGTFEITAKVSNSKGEVEAVKAEKFYLLDKELSEILREADLKPIQNLNLIDSLGLSVLNPQKHSEFNQKAMNAINEHVKYDTLTDGNGVAQITGINPNNYYIFGIHKVDKGFAVWSSPVVVKAGKNNLNIKPQRPQMFN